MKNIPLSDLLFERHNPLGNKKDWDERVQVQLKMSDNSMAPTIPESCLVLGMRVDPEKYTCTNQLAVYAIVTASHTVIRRLYRLKNGDCVLISDNDEHYPQERVAKHDIKELWEIVCAFTDVPQRLHN